MARWRAPTSVIAASAASLVGAAALATFALAAGPARAATTSTAATARPAAATTAIPAGFPNGTNTGVQAGTSLKNVPGQVKKRPRLDLGHRWRRVRQRHRQRRQPVRPAHPRQRGHLRQQRDPHQRLDHRRRRRRHLRRGPPPPAGVTIEHSSIEGTNITTGLVGQGIKDVYGDATGTQVLDNNIQKTDTAVQVYQGTIAGNYIHNLGMVSTDHVNGITTNGDSQPLTIQNNTILNKFGQTDAIGLFQDFSTVSNVTVNDNFLAGGAYTLYGGEGSQGQSSNIKITNNQFSTMYFPKGGAYGPVAYFRQRSTRQHLVRQRLEQRPNRPRALNTPPAHHSATRQARRVALPRSPQDPAT